MNRADLETVRKTKYWHSVTENSIQCDLCPRACVLKEGQRGLCFVRGCCQGEIVLLSYGVTSGFCLDPIEKKPLNHFLPGTPVLSFGSAGCNLSCQFCQNWNISKSRETETLSMKATPEQIARAAMRTGARSIAFTYNDPVIFHEFALDVAQACREKKIKTVAVTAGYVCEEPRREFYRLIDAVNVDLKSFREDFYWKVTAGHLQPVLDTLLYLRHETSVWSEITTLLIPGMNDSSEEIHDMCEWIARELGTQIPLHFSAFHPDWKLRDKPPTSLETLLRARKIAQESGLQFVYTGNVHDPESDSTYCPKCGKCVIGRDGYELRAWHLQSGGQCEFCSENIAGVFEDVPGQWGRRRAAVHL